MLFKPDIALQEDYKLNTFFSGKDVYFNFDKWKSGEINKLCVMGLSGSGKTSLAHKIADEYNCDVVHLDMFRGQVHYSDDVLKAEHRQIYEYFTHIWNRGDRMLIKTMPSDIRNKEFEKMVYWLLERPEPLIIEGMLEGIILNDEHLQKFPIIFKGTSVIKSMYRVTMRELNRAESHNGIIPTLCWLIKHLSKYPGKYSDRQNMVRDIVNKSNNGNYEEINESTSIKHTFTHKELCDIYKNQMISEDTAIYRPHISGNITQSIPGSYFDEETRVWMRKPNKEELQRLNKISIEFKPLIEAKPVWDPKLWRDPGPNIRDFDIHKELKTFMYPQAIKEKYKGPNLYINLPGLSKDKKFRVRCEMIILDSEGRMLVDRKRTFKRMNLSYDNAGGGIEKGEEIIQSAAREAQEEARITVKDPMDSMLWYAYEVPEDSKRNYGFWGVASFICVGRKKSIYKGYIKVDDRDSFVDRAEWIKPEDLKDLLPAHKQAIEMYKNFYLQESLGINMEFLNNEYY